MVFNKIFQHLQPAEIDIIKNVVQFVLDAKLIHKVRMSVKVYSYVRKVVINNFFFAKYDALTLIKHEPNIREFVISQLVGIGLKRRVIMCILLFL